LKRTSITSRIPTGGLSPAYATVGRVLVGFTAILLLVMPWTEHFWHFDGFLISGQDFEFGLLALASIFSLVLVLSKRRAQCVTLLLAVLGWLFSSLQNVLKSMQVATFQSQFHQPPLPPPPLRIYNLPLQI
jgi:hypothetical protein